MEIKQGEGDLEVHDTLQPRQLVLKNGAVLLVEKHLEVTLQMEPNMTLQEAIQQRLQNGSTCSTRSMKDPQVRAHLAPPRLLLEAVTDLHRGLANGEVLSLIPALQAAEGPQAQQEMCTTEPGCAPPQQPRLQLERGHKRILQHTRPSQHSVTCQPRFLSSMPRAKSSVRVQVGDHPHSWNAFARMRKLVPAAQEFQAPLVWLLP